MKISIFLLHLCIITAHLGSVVHESFWDEIAIELEEKHTHDEELVPVRVLVFHINYLLPTLQISNALAFYFTTIYLDNEIDPPEPLIA
jgi:hypothetical protein